MMLWNANKDWLVDVGEGRRPRLWLRAAAGDLLQRPLVRVTMNDDSQKDCRCATVLYRPMQLGNGPRHDVRNKIRVKEHSMHKEQIHTAAAAASSRDVTYLAREPYCD